MKNDFEVIVHRFSKDIVIYPISDVHLGSLEHNSEEWIKFIEKIQNEPNSYVFLVGDLINNATRSSVSNIFEDVLTPGQQKKKMIEFLTPIKDKILCCVCGNHERRSLKDADDDPMYDIMCKLDLEDLYRRNVAFVKIQLNKYGSSTYTFAVTHGAGGGMFSGSGLNRNERFGYMIDGLDCVVVGHTHKGAISKPSKLVFDAKSNMVTVKPFMVVSTQAWMNYGGYAVQKMLLPGSVATADSGQKILLKKTRKQMNVSW